MPKYTELPDNVRGIIWALIATAMFAVAAAMAKQAVKDYHVLQILFFRQLIVFLSSLPSISRSFPESLKTEYPVIHGVRMIGAFVALSCGIWAVAILPLTTAITLGFAKVFFVTLLSLVFLKEAVGIHRIMAVVVGFLGVIVVMRPGVEGIINIQSLIPLFGALGAGFAVISVRKLSQTESTATLLAYQSIFVCVLSGIPLYWLWKAPDTSGFLFLLSMGVVATVGQWFGVKALRLGEASVVGNIEYVKLVYAAILGYFLFSEIPDLFTITGAVIIILSAVYVFHRESLNKRKQQTG